MGICMGIEENLAIRLVRGLGPDRDHELVVFQGLEKVYRAHCLVPNLLSNTFEFNIIKIIILPATTYQVEQEEVLVHYNRHFPQPILPLCLSTVLENEYVLSGPLANYHS